MEQPSAPVSPSQPVSRLPAAIAIVAIAVGTVLRVIEFARNRPLWLDEAMLALNIAAHPFARLARPLDYDQSAPLLYLWVERLCVTVGGVNEQTLRLLPFAAALGLVPLTWFAVRRIAGAATGAVATLLVALSVSLVAFSAEAKQYGVDPLATMVIVYLGAEVAAAPNEPRRWRALVLGGAGCLLLSQPAVFVLGGLAAALTLDPHVRQAASARRWAVVAAIAWTVTFVALYLSIYRATAASAYMRSFWEGTFLDPRAPDFLPRLELFALAAFSAPVLSGEPLVPVWLMAGLWLAGLVSLAWRRSFSAIVVAVPLVLAAVACALGYYAVMDRLFLFAAPLTLLAYAAALSWIVAALPAPLTAPALVGVSAVLLSLVGPTHVRRVRHPVFHAVGKQVIADVDSMGRGEPVYIAARSFPLWVFYTTDWRAPDEERLRWAATIAAEGAPAHNNAPSRGRVRPDEARSLARTYHGRLEIVGLPTGRQYRTTTRTLDPSVGRAQWLLPLQPDTAWAEVEVNRMASAARGRLWVFGSHMFSLDGAEPALVAELERRGVRLVMERRQGSTVAYHVEFPGDP